ncbi:MAG: hypothetical protein E7167_03780 [Firmicutes bacterium]|nr:hypothetical protein [Bacillota bacterium]
MFAEHSQFSSQNLLQSLYFDLVDKGTHKHKTKINLEGYGIDINLINNALKHFNSNQNLSEMAQKALSGIRAVGIFKPPQDEKIETYKPIISVSDRNEITRNYEQVITLSKEVRYLKTVLEAFSKSVVRETEIFKIFEQLIDVQNAKIEQYFIAAEKLC